ncbi:hypothetical protein FRC02_006171 [Tulasnella sp. 418]|nr:hypothetical protein FRC02_006171 [Tulasnella sp. 418]
MTGSRFQLVNGFFLLVTFFCARIIYGCYISWNFYWTLYNVWEQVPNTLVVIYGGGNFLLNILNWIWFTKMIAALQKRFPNDKPQGHKLNGNGVKNGSAKTVEVDGQTLKVPQLNGIAKPKVH